MRRYYKPVTPVEDTVFHIDYWDNSAGVVTGPSDGELRIVLRVPRERVDEWTRSFEANLPRRAAPGPLGDPELSWARPLMDAAGWKPPATDAVVYAQGDSIRAVFEQGGIVIVREITH
ncbi:MAG: hypothetical protein QM767_18695 [Anaeromyxobacter sp.]